MTKRLTTVLLASWLPLASAQAAVAPACPPAIVGVSDLGYSSYLDGGVVRGSNVDVLQAIEKRSGCPLTVRWFPRSRLYAEFFNKRLDLTGASFRSAERDRYGTWLPYTYTRFELVLLNQHAGKFHSLAEFVEHSTARLNITRGIFYTPETQVQLDRLQKLGRLEYVNDYGVVFRKILAGRAEGTLAPATIHLLNQRQFGMLGKMRASTVTESPRAMVGLYVANQVAPEVLQRYADALRSIVEDGTMQRLYEHYLGADITRQLFHDGTREILDALPPAKFSK
ncbi:transporter substrate-binding domain-containing protein [Pseudoduganella sp. FT25W]|jgi:polar amino acid transport system substrate-binding protein|uniref:Transporter substrate-binding domain-containing protein n=1 Tax=Duganella alba TaxID=2666081 RepID=A0A6L5QHU7_9BURK|nr:ABC transporter substrate-binding protein [Duganella alba]MRX09307.1 transporter substrate-binding domain-containing protein [Duganella alba]MRX17171.1 transporter substrate-binding domain-containing protein [Duganella alba]